MMPLYRAENNLQAHTMLRTRDPREVNLAVVDDNDKMVKTQKFQRNDSLKKKAVDGSTSIMSGLEPDQYGSKISSQADALSNQELSLAQIRQMR